MSSNIKVILIKISFISLLFIFLFQDTIYAKEYSVNDCVVIFSDDWVEKKLKNNQYGIFLVNEERNQSAYIIAVPLPNGNTDISEIEGTESGRNAFVNEMTDYLMNHPDITKAEKIIFSEFRDTSSFGTAYIEYIRKTEKPGRFLYVREYDTLKNSTLYTFSFLYVLEDDFTRGAEYDKQIVNNIKFNDKPADSLKNKLQQNLENLVDDAKLQQKRKDDARLYAFLHGGFKAAIYTAVLIGIGFLFRKLLKKFNTKI